MKGAIFDMDGTLVDSVGYWNNNIIKKLDDENVPYPDNVINIFTPMGVKKGCEYIHELGCKKSPDEIYNEIHSIMLGEYAKNIPAKPGAVEYMRKLKEQGVKMCVLSASVYKMIETSAKKCGYYDLIEFIISCDELGITKSETEIFKFAADKLGIPIEDIMVFDDNFTAIKTAKKSGAKTCAVYDKCFAEYEEELKQIADKYIHSFEELL